MGPKAGTHGTYCKFPKRKFVVRSMGARSRRHICRLKERTIDDRDIEEDRYVERFSFRFPKCETGSAIIEAAPRKRILMGVKKNYVKDLRHAINGTAFRKKFCVLW